MTRNTQIDKDTKDLLMSEHSSLREEILKRMELRSQLVSLTLIGAGTFLAISLERNSPTISVLYPILVTFLAVSWVQHSRRNRQLGDYIKEHIEENLLKNSDIKGWEHERRSIGLIRWAAAGIFLGTQLLALIIGLSLLDISQNFLSYIADNLSDLDIILFLIDLPAIGYTAFIMMRLFNESD